MLIATDDDRIIDTDDYDSKTKYDEEVMWNGWEMVARCSQFSREDAKQTLFPSQDRYYLVSFTFDNKVLFARRLSEECAIKWLLLNNHHNLPGKLMLIAKSLAESTKPMPTC